MTREEIKDKIIEKQDEYIEYLKKELHPDFDVWHDFTKEGEIIMLKDQLEKCKEETILIDNSYFPNLGQRIKKSEYEKQFKNRPNPQDVNPYDSKAHKRTHK